MAAGKGGSLPHLLLGNGFSIAQDPLAFTYSALKRRATDLGQISEIAREYFDDLDTVDFELVIRSMLDAARGIRILRHNPSDPDVLRLEAEAASLKDTLAVVLAGLHPSRPADIAESSYERVYGFLCDFRSIYTTNYDLLLYWTLIKGLDPDFVRRVGRSRTMDDGFRDPGYAAEYVTWDYLHAARTQSVFYVHGALHLFRNEDELQKFTWSRTEIALLDQIREQLDAGYFPLYVSEGTSREKLTRIGTSDYLARGLRSLAGIANGLLVYGLAFSENDDHLIKAIAESKISRVGVSVYGALSDANNVNLARRVEELVGRRKAYNSSLGLEVRLFDAGSVDLW
jgi:hypothetical protein